jgi:hypothetical protein
MVGALVGAIVVGAVAVAAIAATPALAVGPATVTVRVEGLSETKLPSTQVTTTTLPVVKNGNSEDFCPGTSALGALQLATGGNWSGKWFGGKVEAGKFKGLGYSIETIEGESHEFGSGYYWSFWLNDKYEETEGACEAEVESGDRVLMFPVCESCGSQPTPLEIEAPPAANVGEPVAIAVKQYNDSGEPSPAVAATVTGGGVSATTDNTGHATLTFPTVGSHLLNVSGSPAGPPAVRTETFVCVHNGNDGTCGTSGPLGSSTTPSSAAGSLAVAAAPYTGPYAVVARITALLEHHHYSRADAPRILTGAVSAPVAVKEVELRLTRTATTSSGARKCSYYDGRTDRFQGMRCGADHGRFFSVGADASFSYLLPFKLPAGRYVLDVEATDLAGSDTKLARGSSRVVFYVA